MKVWDGAKRRLLLDLDDIIGGKGGGHGGFRLLRPPDRILISLPCRDDMPHPSVALAEFAMAIP